MIGDRTYRYIRHTFGTLHHKNLYSSNFGYTSTRKKVAAGSTTAVLAATNGSSTTPVTVTSGITSPDVPRVLTVTVGGTAANVADGDVVITGLNVEGKVITDRFTLTAGGTGTINGTKAFKSVTSIFIPEMFGNGATFAVGTRNILGINHRLFRNNTTVKVYSATAVGVGGYTGLTLQATPTISGVNEDQIELNLITPATTPDGSTFLVIAYAFDNWALSPINDEPEYSTSTSTSSTSSSTSTTTATTTSTSTSSTSSSTSSTSSSTSSTSSSTSSTSTSTTTAP